jgi:hypothetical protein
MEDFLNAPVKVWRFLIVLMILGYMYRLLIKIHKCAFDVWKRLFDPPEVAESE